MAKPKHKYLIKRFPHSLEVWCDNPADYVKDISAIEGTRDILLIGSSILVGWDPRYDPDEITQEINSFMQSMINVPDVFKE